MTDWKTVYGSFEPSTLDTTSSSFVVYQRRNISQRDTFTWQYEERKLTREEFQKLRIEQLENENTNLQLALAELYENLLES